MFFATGNLSGILNSGALHEQYYIKKRWAHVIVDYNDQIFVYQKIH